jgi:hypothetical protein
MPEGDAFTPGPYLGPLPTSLQASLDQLDAGQEPAAAADSRDRALRDLAAMHVATVVAGPSPGRDRIVEFLTGLLGAPPVEVDGVAVWWRVDQLTASQPAGVDARAGRPAPASPPR